MTGSEGVFVLRVRPGSAAERAGLVGVSAGPQGIVPGDLIKEIDGRPVKNVASLFARLDDHRVGDAVRLSVQRAGQTRELVIELQPGI